MFVGLSLLKAGASSQKRFLNVSLTFRDHDLSYWWCVAGQHVSIHCCLHWNVIAFIMFTCKDLHMVLYVYTRKKPRLIQLIQSLQFVLPLLERFSLLEELKSRDSGVSCLAIFDCAILHKSANWAEPDFPDFVYKEGVKISGPHSRVVQGDRDTQSRTSSIISLSVPCPLLSHLASSEVNLSATPNATHRLPFLLHFQARGAYSIKCYNGQDYALLLNKKDHSNVNPLVLPSWPKPTDVLSTA